MASKSVVFVAGSGIFQMVKKPSSRVRLVTRFSSEIGVVTTWFSALAKTQRLLPQ